MKENEITSKYMEINSIRQENNNLKEKLKVNHCSIVMMGTLFSFRVRIVS